MTHVAQVNSQVRKQEVPYSPDSIMGSAGTLTQMACEVAAILEQVSEKQTDLKTLTNSEQQRVAALSANFQNSTSRDKASSMRMNSYQSFASAGFSVVGGAVSTAHAVGGAVKVSQQNVADLENEQAALKPASAQIGGVPANNELAGAREDVATRLTQARQAQLQATNDALNQIEVAKQFVQVGSGAAQGVFGLLSANYTSDEGADQAAATLTGAAQQTLGEAAKVADPAQVQQLRLEMERQIFQAAREANSRG